LPSIEAMASEVLDSAANPSSLSLSLLRLSAGFGGERRSVKESLLSEPASDTNADTTGVDAERRGFLSRTSSALMAGGILASYGTLGWMAARFLYPSKPRPMAWLYVARVKALLRGEAFQYRSPSGQPITLTRQGDGEQAEDFLALSTTCPHLGCRVHWEASNDRFFCPCHNGVFSPDGKATAGPPAEAGQSLPRYALKVENGLLFIEVPAETL
jgi:nitrite reductase/ring-hydroxylating ferredoxin subunit